MTDIILSLTRTSRVGYLRDIRRLTVALSRARLGLYVLGRRSVFEACYELREAFQILLQRPDKLALVTGELWPSTRVVADEAKTGTVANEVAMEGVEHLGQYVFEMTKTKMQQLQVESAAGAGAAGSAEPLALLPGSAQGEGGDFVALPDGDEEAAVVEDLQTADDDADDAGGDEVPATASLYAGV